MQKRCFIELNISGILIRTIVQEQEMKNNQNEKQKMKLSLFKDDCILHTESFENSTTNC